MRKRFFALFILFAFPVLYAQQRTYTPQTIRAGYFNNGDFMHKAEDGSYNGYDIEYYYTIAGYADWNIQFIEYENLEKATAALRNGDIDIMSGLSKTPERIHDFLIASQKMCTTSIAIQTRADDNRFSPSEIKTMENMTCGILKGSNVESLYTVWCKENNLTPHVVEFDTINLRNEALEASKVNSIAAGSTVPGAQRIAEFPALDLYFMVTPKKPFLKNQLDRAMRVLLLENPNYPNALYSRYFPVSRNTAPSFSEMEEAFISDHRTLSVAVLENDPPFSKRTADGSLAGILPEYFEHLSNRIGIEFKCVPYETKGLESIALLNNEVDLIGKYHNDVYEAYAHKLIMTVPYIRMNMIQITRVGTNSVLTVGTPLCNEQETRAFFERSDAPVEVSGYKNCELCFAALKAKQIDAIVCSQPAATWLLNRNRTSDYVASSFGTVSCDLTCALFSDKDGNTLRTIINKAIAVDGTYINQLITKDTLQESSDLTTFIDRLPLSFLTCFTAAVLLLLAISLAALIVIIKRRTQERKLATQQTELAAAVKANEARNTFFGAISHDMRTPLNAIMGFTILAEKEKNPQSTNEYLKKIESSGNLLNMLLDDTLTLSKANSGKLELHLEPVNSEELLDSIIIPISESAEKKHITFIINHEMAPFRTILVDKLSIQKILLNLLTNAVKFTRENGVIVFTVMHDPPHSQNPDTVFIIKDNGIGISESFLPHLFEPFSQESRHGYESTGTGLGLSIVKQLVNKMNGTIDVQSKVEKGTTFTMRIHFDHADIEVPPKKRTITSDADFKGKKVLLCEDNSMNSEIACALLQKKGFYVTTADNGELGLRLFSASHAGEYAVILMDVRMPVMDGYEATQKIRSLTRPDAQTIPIIAMTADAFSDDVQKCLAAGMNSHIAKPIDPDKLFAEIARFLSAHA